MVNITCVVVFYRFAVFGDFGNDNAQSLPRIQQEVQRGKIDAILHVGDMAYDLATVRTRANNRFHKALNKWLMACYNAATNHSTGHRSLEEFDWIEQCNRRHAIW